RRSWRESRGARRSAGLRRTPPRPEPPARPGLLAPRAVPSRRLPRRIHGRRGAAPPARRRAGRAGPEPAPSARWRSPARRPGAIRDVWRDVNARPRAVQLWHAFAAANASRGTTRYAPQALMNNAAIPAELRPRDFTARFSRGAGGLATRRRRRLAGRRLGVLAAAIAVPTMAAPVDWTPGEAVPPPAAQPMAFETPGESFPGSAFYDLDDLPNLRTTAAPGPADEAELALPRPSAGLLDSGPTARPLRLAGTVLDRARAQQCLTMAVYYEAASEPDAGQRAVAQVVLNRVAHPTYPDTVCGVVFQGSERTTGCQFSFTCDGSLARKPAKMWWDRAAAVARAELAGAVYAPVGLATHYHTVQI